MQSTFKFVAFGAVAAACALGSIAASAQSGVDYHPLWMNSPANAEVDAGAVAASHPTGTEPIGQSTMAPMPNGKMTRDEVYRGAVATAHASSSEAIGQSTGMAAVTGGMPH